jgi:hypothetical protein
MKSTPIAACILAAVALVLSAFVYYEYVHMLGFPDGHMTALGLAERALAYAFISMSVIVATFSIYLATTASARRRRLGLTVLIAIYSLASIGMFCLDRFYFKTALNDIG